MYRVTRLNPFSWAKAYTLATLIVAIVVTVLMVIPFFTVVSFAAMAEEDAVPALVAVPLLCLFSVGGLLLLGVFVFVGALIQGSAFNWALGRMGGLELDLALGPNYQAGAALESARTEPLVAPEAAASTQVTADMDPLPPAQAAAAASDGVQVASHEDPTEVDFLSPESTPATAASAAGDSDPPRTDLDNPPASPHEEDPAPWHG